MSSKFPRNGVIARFRILVIQDNNVLYIGGKRVGVPFHVHRVDPLSRIFDDDIARIVMHPPVSDPITVIARTTGHRIEATDAIHALEHVRVLVPRQHVVPGRAIEIQLECPGLGAGRDTRRAQRRPVRENELVHARIRCTVLRVDLDVGAGRVQDDIQVRSVLVERHIALVDSIHEQQPVEPGIGLDGRLVVDVVAAPVQAEDVRVISRAALQPVVARAAVEHVVPVAAAEGIVPTLSIERIIQGGPLDEVVPSRPDPCDGEIELPRTQYAAIVELEVHAGGGRCRIVDHPDGIGADLDQQIVSIQRYIQIRCANAHRESDHRDFRLECAHGQGDIRHFGQVDDIVAETRLEEIGIGTPAPGEMVVAGAANQQIVGPLIEHDTGNEARFARVQDVIARTAQEHVAAGPAIQQIVA